MTILDSRMSTTLMEYDYMKIIFMGCSYLQLVLMLLLAPNLSYFLVKCTSIEIFAFSELFFICTMYHSWDLQVFQLQILWSIVLRHRRKCHQTKQDEGSVDFYFKHIFCVLDEVAISRVLLTRSTCDEVDSGRKFLLE